MDELIKIEKEEVDINQLSPLTWAYAGDCIFELYVRINLINTTRLNPHKMHVEATKIVKAKTQAEMLKNIMENLTEEEQDIVRRGRNAENHHLPKNASIQEYMYSTAFEALIGYLYLCKNTKRVKEIIEMALKTLDFSGKM